MGYIFPEMVRCKSFIRAVNAQAFLKTICIATIKKLLRFSAPFVNWKLSFDILTVSGS